MDYFGIVWSKFLIQALVFLIPTIWATIYIIRRTSGLNTPAWILVAWIIPFIGPLLAFISLRKTQIQT